MKIEPEHRRLRPAYPALASLAATLLAATSCAAQQTRPQPIGGKISPQPRQESATDAARPKQGLRGKPPLHMRAQPSADSQRKPHHTVGKMRVRPLPESAAETDRSPQNLGGEMPDYPLPEPAPQEPPKKP